MTERGPARRRRSAAAAREALVVGLISDTHGLLRPQALAALRGSDRIVHAGDIGDPAILDALRTVAPVTAVRGNNDRGTEFGALPDTDVLQAGAALIYVIHDVHELDLDPAAAGFHVVVSGHSHRPKVEARDGVLYVNPGSAGPRRFTLPIAVGRLHIAGTRVEPAILELTA